MMEKDPLLEALARIEAKQDEQLKNQERMDAHIKQIHADCKRNSLIAGAASGGVAGGVVAVGIAYIRAKLGV